MSAADPGVPMRASVSGTGDPVDGQQRLRALLEAISTVNENLSIEAVHHSVVTAARELTGARYAAFGVGGRHDVLELLAEDGMAASEVEQLDGSLDSHEPVGDTDPIRIDREPGGADGPSNSFLGVPVSIAAKRYGTLYLAGSRAGRFSTADETLMVALALAAGTAISNARRYDESRRQQRWLSASAEIGRQLLADGDEDPLHIIARRAIDIADADLVSLSLLTPDREGLVVEVAFGIGADRIVGRCFPVAETVAGRGVETGYPLLLGEDDETARRQHVASVVDAGPLMVVPLIGSEATRGVLTIVRLRGRPAFTTSDLSMAAGFADYASVAVELADSRSSEQRVLLLEDRERIARDLHDHVIQELFAIGLSLQSLVTSMSPDDPAGPRIQSRIEDLDRTIRRIRTSIFVLRGPLDLVSEGLRQQIMGIASDVTPALGFAPVVSFSGLIDLGTSAELADDVVAAVRETLTNVAKHAEASAVSLDLSVGDGWVVLTVADNGVGISPTTRSSGTANLRSRAHAHGGSFELLPGPEAGTVARWTAQL